MKNAETYRAPNRAILNQFFNGDPPWTEKEAEDNGILVNFNDKQGANLLHQARNQYENAFTKTGQFFKVSLPLAPQDKQESWGVTITTHINNILRNSMPYYYTQDCVWGGVVLHGVGAKMWFDRTSWRPDFVGIQDILIPTDTDLTMENTRYFAVRRGMRPGELFRKTLAKGKNIAPGWNRKIVTKILDSYKDINTNPQNWSWGNNPEQMVELYKQNGSYYDGDAAPMVWFWDFYHREEENLNPAFNGWQRKLMLDRDVTGVPSELANQAEDQIQFVFDSKKPFAEKINEIIHFQFGDGNNVPPFKYHSIRSLSWLIYDLVWTMNRLNCQFTQHVFEQMMLLFKINDPADRDRLTKLILQGIVGLIPDGLTMVTAQERYQVDANLVQSLGANLKQRVGEATSQYTQNIDSGTQKERTKFEVQALLSQTSALMSSMLGRAYRQEHFAYVEIARRFSNKGSDNFDVKKFRRLCLEDGVPEMWLTSERWEVEVEQVLGGGNRMVELAEATELMDRVHMFDPQAQLEIKHDYVLAVTNNPKKANRLAPLNSKNKVSDGMHDAQLAFGSLMMGVDMEPKHGLNHIDQVETLLRMMGQVIQRINATGGVGTPEDVFGLQSVAKYTGKHIEIIAMDPNEKPRVKMYTDALSKMMNEVRAFMQRQQEAAEKAQQEQINPETIQKIQSSMAETQAKLQQMQAKGDQQLRQKEEAHQQKMAIQAEAARTDTTIKQGQAIADTQIAAMSAAANADVKKEAAKNGGGSGD